MTTSYEVPTLDLLSGTLEQQAQIFGDGFAKIGFVNVVNHGILKADMDRLYDVSRRTFSLSLAAKLHYMDKANHYFTGYAPQGSEHAKDDPTPDIKEFWHIRKHVPAEMQMTPSEITDFQAVTLRMIDQLDGVGNRLLRLLEIYLDLAPDTLVDMVVGGNSLLRLLRYPHILPGMAGVRAGQHEDINFLTLLMAAIGAGLEVLTKDGVWLPISNPPDSLIANAGDMLQASTAGKIVSTTHRVVNGDGSERFSAPYFIHPRSEVVLVQYPRLTAGEFLLQRLREIHGTP